MFKNGLGLYLDRETKLRPEAIAERLPKSSWRIPAYPSVLEKAHKVRRANRYLLFQDIRISRMINRGEYTKAVKCFIGMLRTSQSFRVYAFNRYVPGWYGLYSREKSMAIFRKFSKLCIEGPLRIPINRTYIPKRNGKMRPIGVPLLPYRAFNSVVAEFISRILEPTRNVMPNQHGFRSGRGVWSAGMSIAKLLRQHNHVNIYEFDLRGYFNLVKPQAVHDFLESFDPGLAGYTLAVNLLSFPNFKPGKIDKSTGKMLKAYYPETEVSFKMDPNGRGALEKSGLPQGLPGSPVLCIEVLRRTAFRHPNVIMYADDGLIMLPDSEGDQFKRIVTDEALKDTGAMFQGDKSGIVREKLKFLGATLDLKTNIIDNGKESIDFNLLKSEEEFKAFFAGLNPYKEEAKRGEGDIHPNSGLRHYGPRRLFFVMRWGGKGNLNRLGEIFFDYKIFNIPKNIREDVWILYNFITSSSLACYDLLSTKRVRPRVPLVDLTNRKAFMLPYPELSKDPDYFIPYKLFIQGKMDNAEMVRFPSQYREDKWIGNGKYLYRNR